jgi:phenylalanyl-tRNA synthetase beta chain
MRVPYSWLRDFAPIEHDPVELAAVLDGLGMVVEHLDRVGEGFDGVVVARVLDTRPHPDADKVQLVDVDAGGSEPLQIVCGAFNFSAGDLVPLATIGATLPGGMEIARRKVRGQWSSGMLCASDELGLGDDHSGIMVLSTSAGPGSPLAEALGITADVVYDLDITANRPDAMSVAGVARDVAAKLGIPFTLPDPVLSESGPPVSELTTVIVDAPDLCPRFTARVISGIEIGPSPPSVQARLTLAGMRPINNVVDASNYVMLELGQPTHPYDRDRLPGHGFVVRRARAGEVVQTLDGVERAMHPDDCLICDAAGDPVGIGGIMGGASSEISDSTRDVVLEAAYFTPMVIARSAKRLNLRTEASARFERGCDPEGIDRSALRLIELMGTGALASGALDVRASPPERPVVRVRTDRLNGLLGTDLGEDRIRSYLEPIGFSAEPASPGLLDVAVPSWRPDVRIEEDVIEEVGRHHGYANIPRTLPASPHAGGLTAYQRERRLIRDVMVGLGVDEAVNSPLVGPDDHAKAGVEGEVIRAANPMMREESVLRRCLLPGLLRNLAFNAAHRNPEAALFEVGKVFLPPLADQVLPDEREYVAAALAGRDAPAAVDAWRTLADALRLDQPRLVAGGVPGLHPARSAAAWAGDVKLGVVGEVDPAVVEGYDLSGRIGWLELDLGRLHRAPRRSEELRPVSRYPSSDIDLAFVVPGEVPAGDVEQTLRASGGELLEHLGLFDVYRGPGIDEGSRSLAYRLRFCALDRTLTDAEVGEIRARCIEAVESAHGAQLRG